MQKLTIEVNPSYIDQIVIDDLKEVLKFCSRNGLIDFVPSFEKVLQYYMTPFDYYTYMAEQHD